jgi:hypothetical protein
LKIYLAVTTTKKPKVIIADFSYETCAKLGKIYSRNRKFKIVERYFPFDDNESISRLMEGVLLSRIDFITKEKNAHFPNELLQGMFDSTNEMKEQTVQ